MGNLCGKQSKDNFQGPGRTVGAAPAPATKSSIPAGLAKPGGPASAKPQVGGPARTVGGKDGASDDPRSAAAAAAEARANKAPAGDLQKKLDAQKKQTHNQTLQQAADENRMQREVDAATETRNYN